MLSRPPGIGLIGAVRTAERVVEALAPRNVALAALRVHRRSGGWPGGIGRYLRLSHRRRRCVGWRARHARHVRLLHEILPDLYRQRAAGDTLHRAVIVIADPDADDKGVVEPD